jgi:cellulose synthase/poly-beta-1,6-N-acetylglucosamine synthase-like glycosyltransferase
LWWFTPTRDIQPCWPCEPSVTLLIAAYNEEAFIRQKLENALHLDYPAEKLQILVAADGSDDQTADIVRSFAAQGVQLSFQPARLGKMAAINRAMELARGEVVVFSDANNLYEPGTLRALVLPFGDPLVGGVSGAKHVIQAQDGLSKSEGLYWKYESFIKKQETRLGSCSGVSGEVFAIRRHLFEPAPAGIINDDFYMALRLLRRGCRIVYSSQARSFERVSLTAEDEIIRRTRINAGRYQAVALAGQLFPFNQPVLLWQIISHKLMRLLVPFAMIGALITNFIALFLNDPGAASAFWALKQPFSSLFFALQCLFYLMAWVGNLGKITGKAGKVLYLPAFLFNSNLAAWQGFMRFITGRQTALWQRARRAEEGDGQHGA